MDRRTFGMLLALGLALPPARAQARPKRRMRHTLIKPRRLEPGDTVGLIAPAGRTSEESIEKASSHIEALGFRVQHAPHLREIHGNYAGTAQQRLDDLHGMFTDPAIKALWCIRGGSGAISLLQHIDYRLIRRHPKILIGYSDITALHLAILRHAGLVTFHGPVASSGPSEYANRHLLELLMQPQREYIIPPAEENLVRALSEPQYSMRTVHEGVATGRLIGGNLSLVAALAGTPYAADFRDALVFLEEVNEEPYRIDRWMTQLDLSAGFRHAAGVMIGVCENCVAEEGSISLTFDETVDQFLEPLKRPAVAGWSFGHIRHQFTLPVGVRARMDTKAGTLTLLEPAVT
ncbi:MAG TPA: LD-carboxypeptidase [Telluria sp.]|nr:LD-carboxypeptidase [Telluria sp.]